MSDLNQAALDLHRANKGKLATRAKVSITNKEELALAYSPGVAAVSRATAADPELLYELSPKGNMVAIVSDGSAVLGLGDIGPAGAYPVMEGKSLLLKEFAGVDSIPLVVKTQDVDEIVELVDQVSVNFGGINLEDISAPRCFEIEARLKERLKIPVFHDDQHGTAIVVLAGLLNALKVVGKDKSVRILVNGAGAAGMAITKLLLAYGFKHVVLLDTVGAIYEGRPERMNPYKDEIAKITNPEQEQGTLQELIYGVDVFLGVSKGGLVTQEMVKQMAKDPIIFAMANPDPEISEADAREAGVAVMATGRSDSPNQINNVLAFPGLFRGALDARIEQFEERHFVAAAEALAALVPEPHAEYIVPSPFDPQVVPAVSRVLAM